MQTEKERFRAWRIVRLRGRPPQWHGSAWRIAAHIYRERSINLCVALAEYQKSIHIWEDAYAALERKAGAAPELLAALENATDAMAREDFGTITLLPKLRAAISRARGRP